MSHFDTIAGVEPALINPERGRGPLTPARLEEHLEATGKRLKSLGIRPGDRVASLLPEGPDAATLRLALAANLVSIPALATTEQYVSHLSAMDARLLVMHPAEQAAREAARVLHIPVANVLRHFEAGVFTLEAAVAAPARAAKTPSWKQSRTMPLVLIAPSAAYRRLSARLDPNHPVIGITPPSLEHLPAPHTIEHVAAESVRMLRRYRPHGPYALAGWRAEALVALEMARLLEEEGEKVAFVAMLDAADLLRQPVGPIQRVLFSLRRPRYTPTCEFMAAALRQYSPRPWYGKVIHISPSHITDIEWIHVAPQGLTSYSAPSEMLAEPNVEAVAQILAAELSQAPTESASHS